MTDGKKEGREGTFGAAIDAARKKLADAGIEFSASDYMCEHGKLLTRDCQACEDEKPLSKALAAWRALPEERRALALGAIEQEARESWLQLHSEAMKVAVALLREAAK